MTHLIRSFVRLSSLRFTKSSEPFSNSYFAPWMSIFKFKVPLHFSLFGVNDRLKKLRITFDLSNKVHSEGVYRRLYFGRNEIFQFGVWSISYNCCLEMKLIPGVISLRSFWQKWTFTPSDKILCKHYLKWNHPKGNICACEYFIKTKIVGQKIETRITSISFRPQWQLT